MSGRTRAAHPLGSAVLRLALTFLLCVSSFAVARPTTASAAYPSDDQTWPANPGYDVVYGGAWTRQTLIDWMWLYKKYGFNENFAYYSQEKLIQVVAGDTRRFATRMPYYYSGTQASLGPDANGLYMTKLEAVFVPGAYIRVWANGSAFVAKVNGAQSSVAVNPLPPKITGYRYEDLDSDGVRDAGEVGVSGAEVQLWRDGARIATATTDATGLYQFTIDGTQGLAPGVYEMRSPVGGGWRATTAASKFVNVVAGMLSANKTYTGNDFGAARVPIGEIAGVVYFDENGNATRDAGEPGVPGRTVTLSKAGSQVRSALTAADGTYSFTALSPGSYTAQAVLPAPWRGTQPPSGSYAYELLSDTKILDADFGSTIDGSIKPYMANDLNGDGLEDAGEPLLPGWTMRLGDGVGTELRDPLTTLDSLAASPAWMDVPAGSYSVWFDEQPGWSATSPLSRPVMLGAGQDVTVGFSSLQLAEIQVAAFVDANSNGVRDEGESPLADRTLALSQAGQPIRSATTGADGLVTFANLSPGAYQVSEGPTPWWRHTSDPIQPVSVSAGQCSLLHYGDILTGAISGVAAEDSDGDGVAEEGEPPAAGVAVTLETADGQAVAGPVTTDAGGRYTFADVTPGEYVVMAAYPTGWLAGSAVSQTVTVAGGATVQASDFLGTRGVSVTGTVFDDSDASGAFGAAEQGVPGREVVLERLVDGTWTLEGAVFSAESGSYGFEMLPPGEYRVSETSVDGWRQTTDAGITGFLGSGSSAGAIELGSIGLSRIEVFKFDDASGNGVYDEGEAPRGGLTLDVTGTGVDGSAFTGTVTTDANGMGIIEGLMPGSYRITDRAIGRSLNPDGSVIEAGWQATTPSSVDVALGEGVVERATFGALHLGWISGRVTHEVWNTPVAGVRVTITETGQSTTTDANGYYFFYGLEPNGTSVCPTPNYLVGMTVDGITWKTNDAVNKSAVVTAGGHSGADFTVYNASVGNTPRTVNYWSTWTKNYTTAQMQSLVSSVNVGSSEFTTLTVADVTPVMTITKRSTAREKARAQYLAFWLNVASGNLGLYTTVDVSKVTDWQSYLDSAQPSGITTVIGVLNDMEAVFTEQWLPAAWDTIRSILDGINGGQYTGTTGPPASAASTSLRK